MTSASSPGSRDQHLLMRDRDLVSIELLTTEFGRERLLDLIERGKVGYFHGTDGQLRCDRFEVLEAIVFPISLGEGMRLYARRQAKPVVERWYSITKLMALMKPTFPGLTHQVLAADSRNGKSPIRCSRTRCRWSYKGRLSEVRAFYESRPTGIADDATVFDDTMVMTGLQEPVKPKPPNRPR